MKRLLLTITMLVCFFNGYAEKTDSLKIYKSKCDSLTATIDSLRYKCASLSATLLASQNLHHGNDEYKHLADSLSAIVEGLYPVRIMVAKNTDSTYASYHKQKFAKQNLAEIDSVLSVAGSLRIGNLSVLISNLENAKSLKMEYDSLYAIVSEQAYDEKLIEPAKDRAKSLLVRVCSPDQKKEVETLMTALKTYPNAMKELEDLVAWLVETMDLYRPNGSPTGAKTSLESIIGSQKSVIATINKVPYLKELFNQMVTDLRQNPIQQGKAEKRLVELIAK